MKHSRRMITKTNKINLYSVQAIRSLLLKNGFSVGRWSANGRISGLSGFHGGDFEVREFYISDRIVSEVVSDVSIRIVYEEVAGVQVRRMNNNEDKSLEDALNLLAQNYPAVIYNDSIRIGR